MPSAATWAHESPRDEIAARSARIDAGSSGALEYLNRGELYRLEQDWEAAEADYERAARLDPSLAEVHLCRGALFLATGRPARAVEEIDRFLAWHADHAGALELKARSALALDRPAEAIRLLDRAIDATTRPTPDLYLERARVQVGRGDRFVDQALSDLDEGLERLGPVVSLESFAIELELRRRRPDAALARLDRIAPQFERREAVLERRGEILARAGRADEARLAFAAARAEIEGLPASRRASLAAVEREGRLAKALEASGVRQGSYQAREPEPDLDEAPMPAPVGPDPASAETLRPLRPETAAEGSALATAVVTRGPYLQVGTPTSVVVRWRTDSQTDSRVRFGKAPGALFSVQDDPVLTTEHEVRLEGLFSGRRYYYSVGTTSDVLAGDNADHTFVTPPIPGTPQATRVWVIGDSGTADLQAAAVRDAFAAYTGDRATDLWLMLGDNAYENGSDRDYQAAVFDMYPELLRTSVLWPTRGNHDHLHSGLNNDYYDIFTLPIGGQAGGVASGTEAYYSFDYANIHFICLDSEVSDRAPGGPMLTWLEADLAATKREWVIAFWHHPPYSRGSHNSDDGGDSGGRLRDMRQNALPILEAAGVDLVLTGHSHSYERSFLLDGHYGVSTTLSDAMKVDPGDGRADGDGAYWKPAGRLVPHQGAVYAVAGSSGKVEGGRFNHPVMITSLMVLGSLVLDVSGDRLEARFLDSAGAVRDSFTILKSTAQETPVVAVPERGPAAGVPGIRSIGPNPFVGETRIGFWLPAPGRMKLSIVDAGGRRVRALLDGARSAGPHELVWDGRDPSGREAKAGVYFVVLESEDRVSVRRITLTR